MLVRKVRFFVYFVFYGGGRGERASFSGRDSVGIDEGG